MTTLAAGHTSVVHEASSRPVAVLAFGDAVPKIESVMASDKRKVRVIWEGGGGDEIDLSPVLATLARHSVVLSSDRVFRSVNRGPGGRSIVWTDGSVLPAAWVYELRLGQMSNQEFRDHMVLLKLTLTGMAAVLGIGRRNVAHYRKDKPVPRYVAMAVRSLLERSAGAVPQLLRS